MGSDRSHVCVQNGTECLFEFLLIGSQWCSKDWACPNRIFVKNISPRRPPCDSERSTYCLPSVPCDPLQPFFNLTLTAFQFFRLGFLPLRVAVCTLCK